MIGSHTPNPKVKYSQYDAAAPKRPQRLLGGSVGLATTCVGQSDELKLARLTTRTT
jgi:hypothetical protein